MRCITKLSLAKLSLATLVSVSLLTPSLAFAGWDEGVAAFKGGDYRQASEHFSQYIRSNPTAPQAHYMLGRSLLQEKRLMESLGPLEEALKLAPAESSYRLAFAQAQLKAHRADAALETLAAQDLAMLPDNQRQAFDNLLARSATGSKDAEAAHQALRDVLKEHDDDASLWLALANVERRRDAAAAAFDALRRAFDIDGQSEVGTRAVQTAFSLARDSVDTTRQAWYSKAGEIAERLATSEPTADHLLLAGEARLGAKDFAEAASWFDRAAALRGDDPLPHYYLARCALAESQGEEALTHLDAASRRSPGADLAEQILLAKGSALRQTEAFDLAAAVYRQVGRADKVAEMENLAETKRKNAAWDIEKKRCQQKRDEIRQLMDDAADLRGSVAWQELEEANEHMLAECSSYFDVATL